MLKTEYKKRLGCAYGYSVDGDSKSNIIAENDSVNGNSSDEFSGTQ
jgi:hypothetical protein